MTLKWCGFGSVLYSLFDTVSLNNLKLSKDIYLGDNFLTNFAVISNTFGLIIFFVLSISLKVKYLIAPLVAPLNQSPKEKTFLS